MRLQLTLLSLLATACVTPKAAPGGVGVGDTIDFVLPDMKGDRFSPEDVAGQVVLVDLWATWCKPCKVSMPFYASLYEQHKSDGFTVLAISVDEEEDAVFDFIDRNPLPFTVLRDPKGSVPRAIGIATLPTMVLLGRDGRIVYVHPGFERGDRERIADEVAQALTVSAMPGDAPKE